MKRIILVGVGVVMLLALVGGAAYVGGQMLAAQSQPQASSSGPQVRIDANGQPGKTISLAFDRSPDLPATPLLLKGIYVRRADNSVFVGTGAVKLEAQKKPDGTVSMTSNYDGPIVEVVVTHSTSVYRDVTLKQFNGVPPSGQKIAQVVEPGTLDEIGENSTLQVWGERNGDRAVASVLVYSLPSIMNAKPGAGPQ